MKTLTVGGTPVQRQDADRDTLPVAKEKSIQVAQQGQLRSIGQPAPINEARQMGAKPIPI